MKTIANALMLLFFSAITGFSQPLADSVWTEISSGFQFPEGPAWDGTNTLYVSNCNSDWIARVRDGRLDTLATDTAGFGKTNGMWVQANGHLLACDFGTGAILDVSPEGEVSKLITEYEGEAFNRPNDIIQLSNGSIYFTDPKDYGKYPPEGRVFYYGSTDDELRLAADSLNFPNGLAISPKDGKLYVCESAKNRILSYIRKPDGTLSGKEVFIELPKGDPDGIEFDIRGNMYMAHFGSGSLFVISPQGTIMQVIQTPGKKPTNLDFGGPGMKTLFLTEVETGAVYAIKTKYAGVALP